ncbi:hypothetical protein RND71_026800 [Anisodus tanguticus]|uniref:Uncharacterized protein n=1 Tax=Anisodus tanguticus TaxID=243964 RepID=A0AAE1RPB7_9SOLA|nr:hypothetical protein RND71_026800 [Anisodus tanguticus]
MEIFCSMYIALLCVALTREERALNVFLSHLPCHCNPTPIPRVKNKLDFDPRLPPHKDFQTGTLLMRCDSQGELYPITSPIQQSKLPSTFAAFAPSLWHERLGHPRALF